MFSDEARFIDQILASLCQAQTDYTCCKDSSIVFSKEFYIKGTLFLSRKTFYLRIIILYWLLGFKKT